MPKVIIIADIHANLPALRAFLEREKDWDYLIHAGDLVGYNPFPNETIEEFSKLPNTINILGNHDDALLTQDYSGMNEIAVEAIRWTDSVILPSNLKYLTKLKDFELVEIGGRRIGIVHGGMTSHLHEYVLPFSPAKLLNEYLAKANADILIFGHTHQMFVRSVEKGIVINPGSIGQPRDGDPRPSYIVLNINEEIDIKPVRFSYNIDEVAKKIKEVGLPSFLAERLYEGV